MTIKQSSSIQHVFDVLIATFPGRPTDQAVDDLQQEVLRAMDDVQPRGVVLDISAVTTLDSFFARVISETAGMISLMGGKAIVVGMRPSVAITAAELGFDLDQVETARSTDHALRILGISVDDVGDDQAVLDDVGRSAPERGPESVDE